MAVKTIYYRGALRSCNYTCAYCSLRKNKTPTQVTQDEISQGETNQDKASHDKTAQDEISHDKATLLRFCEKMRTLTTVQTVMFVPAGEALQHDYYHASIAQLCAFDHICTVGCQTNLSFDIEKFTKQIQENINKISLWCTFHPTQTNADAFLAQCALLEKWGINYCVGAVAHSPDIAQIQGLRARLSPTKYMWLNAQPKQKYTPTQREAFLAIDPLFTLELHHPEADITQCIGGRESIFAIENGDFFACNISKVKLGNLYRHPVAVQPTCRAKRCDCYLAYANRTAMADYFMHQSAIPVRNPNPQTACFFDVDGTLTDKSGKIPAENIDKVRLLAKKSLIFLATSLPYPIARRKCRAIWKYISGGVFAEGSDMRIFPINYKKILPLNHEILQNLTEVKHICYHEDGQLHKITAFSHIPDRPGYHIVREGVASIVTEGVSKLNGIRLIGRKLNLLAPNITAIGNSKNDLPMMQYFNSRPN